MYKPSNTGALIQSTCPAYTQPHKIPNNPPLSSTNSGIRELVTEPYSYNKLSLFCGKWLWAKRGHLLPVTRAQERRVAHRRAFMMLMNSGFSAAPPTKKPSTSGCVPSSLQFSDVTEPTMNIYKNLSKLRGG